MKKKQWLAGLLALALFFGVVGCGETEPIATPITSAEEAYAAVEAGRYEDAYLYLVETGGDPARDLLQKLVFVPTRRTQTQIDDQGTLITTWDYTYDAHGRLLSRSEQSDGGKETQETCTYDDQGRLTRVVVENYAMASTTQYDVVYDGAGYSVTKTHFDQVETYRYDWDKEPKPTPLPEPEYRETYDQAGRVILRERIRDNSRSDKIEYTYDRYGNVVTEHDYEHRGEFVTETEYQLFYYPDGFPISYIRPQYAVVRWLWPVEIGFSLTRTWAQVFGEQLG